MATMSSQQEVEFYLDNNLIEDENGQLTDLGAAASEVPKEKLKCNLCSAKYASKSSLQYHMAAHAGKKPYKCSYCDYAAIAKFQLNQHMRQHTNERPYACSYCSYRSSCSSNLRSHVMLHTGQRPYACNKCNFRGRTSASVRQHQVSHITTKKFHCEQCDYKGKTSQLLMYHRRTHEPKSSDTPRKQFICDYCQHGCSSKTNLAAHIRSHTGEKPFACLHCDFRTATKSCLFNHNRIHTNHRPYACRFCDYTAKESQTLKSHERRHTGERPYACKFCIKTFPTLQSLKKHVSKEHSSQGMNAYPCFVCEERFKTPLEWQEHFRMHMGGVFTYACSLCSYTSEKKSHLAVHMTMKHISEEKARPWFCKLCSREFPRKYPFRRHLKIHKFASHREKCVFLRETRQARLRAPSDQQGDVAEQENHRLQEPEQENYRQDELEGAEEFVYHFTTDGSRLEPVELDQEGNLHHSVGSEVLRPVGSFSDLDKRTEHLPQEPQTIVRILTGEGENHFVEELPSSQVIITQDYNPDNHYMEL